MQRNTVLLLITIFLRKPIFTGIGIVVRIEVRICTISYTTPTNNSCGYCQVCVLYFICCPKIMFVFLFLPAYFYKFNRSKSFINFDFKIKPLMISFHNSLVKTLFNLFFYNLCLTCHICLTSLSLYINHVLAYII